MAKKTSQSSFRSDSPTQLQQKIIHYRSEISRYQNIVEKYEKKLEQLKRDINEVRNKEPEIKEIERTEIQSYFNYSLILPPQDEEDRNIIVIGSLILKNIGNTPLSTPVICLKVEPSDYSSLSGKIKMTAPNISVDEDNRLFEEAATEEWVYIHENWREKIKETGEYWLRPTHQTEIAPGEQMSFSNFNLTIKPKENQNSTMVNGFVYLDEIREGVAALNSIIINY